MSNLSNVFRMPSRPTAAACLLVCCIGAYIPHPGMAQEPTRDELRRRIFAEVQRLNSEDPANRSAGEQALRDAGLAALPILTNTDFGPLSSSALEILQRVRDELLAERLRQDQEPTRVTLEGTMTLGAALEALGEQAQVKIDYSTTIDHAAAFDSPAEFHLSRVEFWRAFDAVLAAGNLQLALYGGEPGQLRVVAAPHGATSPGAASVDYQGPFRLAVAQCTATRNPRHPALDQLAVTLQVDWEPRVRVLAIRQPLAKMQVESDLASIETLPKNAAQTAEAAVRPGQFRAELPLLFQLPPRNATQLTRLRGTLEVLVLGPAESFTFANLDLSEKNVRRERGAISLRLAEWREVQGGYAVELELLVSNDDAVESFRNWPAECDVFLDLGMGVRVPPASQEILRQSASSVAVRCLFTQDPSGTTLVYEAPLAVTPLSIPYELRGIILP